MANKFSQYLTDNKIDPRRLIVASRAIERLRPEDRKTRLTRRQAKKAETKAAEGEKPAKPRSGRAVTPRLIAGASAGKALSGAAKTRLLRALNRVLEQKKQKPADLRALF